jgi:hypothetical protein
MTNQNQNPEVIVIDRAISRCNFIKGEGTYRAIVKSKAGFMTTVDDLGVVANWSRKEWLRGIDVFRDFKKGALQSIQFQAEGSKHWLTVFAKVGTKIKLIDDAILADMNVGDINQNWSNTNLYNQYQYQAVGAKTWADKAYVKNI